MDNQAQLNVVDLQNIFAAPINAVIDADFMAARRFVAYLEEFGFEPKPPASGAAAEGDEAALARLEEPDHLGRLRMISFRLDRLGADGKPHPVVVKLPALSLIPLPLLHVQDADFRYGVRLLQAVERIVPRPLRLLRNGDGDEPPHPVGLQWRAMIADRPLADPARDALAPQLNANLEVNVKLRQADIPAGVATLLGLFGETAQVLEPTPTPAREE
jgi:hypothetical protein